MERRPTRKNGDNLPFTLRARRGTARTPVPPLPHPGDTLGLRLYKQFLPQMRDLNWTERKALRERLAKIPLLPPGIRMCLEYRGNRNLEMILVPGLALAEAWRARRVLEGMAAREPDESDDRGWYLYGTFWAEMLGYSLDELRELRQHFRDLPGLSGEHAGWLDYRDWKGHDSEEILLQSLVMVKLGLVRPDYDAWANKASWAREEASRRGTSRAAIERLERLAGEYKEQARQTLKPTLRNSQPVDEEPAAVASKPVRNSAELPERRRRQRPGRRPALVQEVSLPSLDVMRRDDLAKLARRYMADQDFGQLDGLDRGWFTDVNPGRRREAELRPQVARLREQMPWVERPGVPRPGAGMRR